MRGELEGFVTQTLASLPRAGITETVRDRTKWPQALEMLDEPAVWEHRLRPSPEHAGRGPRQLPRDPDGAPSLKALADRARLPDPVCHLHLRPPGWT